MWYFIISAIALFIISITMLARANDLRWRPGLVWNARLIGFIMAGFTPAGTVIHEWLTEDWPSLYECMFRVGLMLVFLTTPYLPPWWKWISGLDNSSPVWSDDRRNLHPEEVAYHWPDWVVTLGRWLRAAWAAIKAWRPGGGQ